MSVENGEWVIKGLEYDAPGCIHSPVELIAYAHPMSSIDNISAMNIFFIFNLNYEFVYI